ncbi:hypothetical protein CR513_58840, partial [Mucuna pruriens]
MGQISAWTIQLREKVHHVTRRNLVGPYVLLMIGYIKNLQWLGFPLGQELTIDVILHSLPNRYSQFIMNYNINDIHKLLPKLLSMLKTAQQNLNKGKGNPSWWFKVAKAKCNSKSSKTSKKERHWKRKCHKYLEECKKKKGSDTSALNTGYGSHICSNVQELSRSKTLARNEVDLQVRNRANFATLVVGTYVLTMLSELIIELDNCYSILVITKNMISISCLGKKVVIFYFDDIFYGIVLMINRLYVLDLYMPIYNINTKRVKINDLNPANLWHCCLDRISEKCISKLHKDGFLKTFDYESTLLIGKDD